jgi:hypothetical protein
VAPLPPAPPHASDADRAVPAPADAAAALQRARAAYEYGDIDEVVTWARQVAEGRYHPSPLERLQALRYLGIGLYLTGRPEGAEAAFFELLRLRPEATLDPRTTRPDVVAFYEGVRRRHDREIRDAARESNPRPFAWNFLPPAGQFQNGHRGRGFVIAALEVLSLAGAITSRVLLDRWSRPDHTFPDEGDAHALKIVNYASVALLAATYVYGVLDGIAHHGDPPPEATGAELRLSFGPGGVALQF